MDYQHYLELVRINMVFNMLSEQLNSGTQFDIKNAKALVHSEELRTDVVLHQVRYPNKPFSKGSMPHVG